MASTSEFMPSYRAAGARAAAWDAAHARAVLAEYHPAERRVHVELSNGALFAFPVDDAQGLADASDEDIAAVDISPSGYALEWRSIDVDLLLEPLMRGVLGTREWMREIGRRGGRRTSKRKASAARRNGAKGGRPRKRTTRER